MADYPTVVLPTGGYSATFKGWNHQGHTTPNFEVQEGMRFGPFYPAPYLPTVRLERQFEDYIVIGAGKAVGLDSLGWLIPVGLKLYLAQKAAAPSSHFGPQYSATDVNMGIKNAQGNSPNVGDYVVDSMYAGGVTVGYCLGALSYDAYLLSGSDPNNPATYRFHNYNRQSGVAVLTDYLLEFPVQPLARAAFTTGPAGQVVSGAPLSGSYAVNLPQANTVSTSLSVLWNNNLVENYTFSAGTGPGGVDQVLLNTWVTSKLLNGDVIVVTGLYSESFYAAPWAGMATWKGAASAGAKVTYDQDSNWVMYVAPAIGNTMTANQSAAITAALLSTLDVVGSITKVDTNFPKQYLDRVKTAFDPRLTGALVDGLTGLPLTLDQMPGSATNGLPSNIYFAGGDQYTGVVKFNLNIT